VGREQILTWCSEFQGVLEGKRIDKENCLDHDCVKGKEEVLMGDVLLLADLERVKIVEDAGIAARLWRMISVLDLMEVLMIEVAAAWADTGARVNGGNVVFTGRWLDVTLVLADLVRWEED
jgi:hypothetical protein